MRLLFGLFCIALSGTSAARAGETAWQRAQFLSYRLVWIAPSADRAEAVVGVQVRPDRGYKIFWRSAGALGLPTRFDLAGSGNVAASSVLWPVPRRLEVDGLDATGIGYDRETVFLIRLVPAASVRPIELRLAMEYGVCGDVCVPGEAKFSIAVPQGDPADTTTVDLIQRFSTRVPASVRVPIQARRAGDAVVVEIRDETGFKTPDIFLDAGLDHNFARPQRQLSSGKREARFHVPLESGKADALPATIHIVVVDDGRAVAADVPLGR